MKRIRGRDGKPNWHFVCQIGSAGRNCFFGKIDYDFRECDIEFKMMDDLFDEEGDEI